MNGTDLLHDIRQGRSEGAFGALVRRHTNLVYSIARRRTGEDALAQEVAQIVFIRLARTMPRLRDETQLVAWPVLWEDSSKPLHEAWYVRSRPTILVIDSAGIIRYRGSYSTELHQLLKSLTTGL